MSNFLKKSEILTEIVQEIVYVAPQDWSRIVYYTERMADSKLGMRNASIERCWMGNDMTPFNTSKGAPLDASMELYEAENKLFMFCLEDGEKWTGLGILLNSTGNYRTKFYYEDIPLIENDYSTVNKRLDEISKL